MVLNGSTRKELPVRLIDGKVKLRVLIDRASVEIFANDGEYTATTFVVHKPENRGVRSVAWFDFSYADLAAYLYTSPGSC